MTGLHHTALKTSQMIECAASALVGQQRHGTKTHLNQAYGICRACVPVDETQLQRAIPVFPLAEQNDDCFHVPYEMN